MQNIVGIVLNAVKKFDSILNNTELFQNRMNKTNGSLLQQNA